VRNGRSYLPRSWDDAGFFFFKTSGGKKQLRGGEVSADPWRRRRASREERGWRRKGALELRWLTSSPESLAGEVSLLRCCSTPVVPLGGKLLWAFRANCVDILSLLAGNTTSLFFNSNLQLSVRSQFILCKTTGPNFVLTIPTSLAAFLLALPTA